MELVQCLYDELEAKGHEGGWVAKDARVSRINRRSN